MEIHWLTGKQLTMKVLDSAHHQKAFNSLSEKQKTTLELVAEGFTGKEIAAATGISQSAVTHRIEAIRRKFGGATRGELVRIYNDVGRANAGPPSEEDFGDCKFFTGDIFAVQPSENLSKSTDQGEAARFALADSQGFDFDAPWPAEVSPRIVPEVLDGEHGTALRIIFALGIALFIAMIALVILGISDAIIDL